MSAAQNGTITPEISKNEDSSEICNIPEVCAKTTELPECRKVTEVKPSLAHKISEKIKREDKLFFSMEFMDPKSEAGIKKLISSFERLRDGGTLFCSVTWHGGSNSGKQSSMKLAEAVVECGLDSMIHMTGAHMDKQEALSHLNKAQELGVRNVLALRGDIPPGCKLPKENFPYAADFVRFLRSNFGDYFSIGVAGYPAGHHDAPSYHLGLPTFYQQDLKYLKAKVDAGADFIISQIFFEAKTFIKFVKDCRAIGITVPIIPGILPITSYKSLYQLARLCFLKVPADLSDKIEKIKGNEEAVRQFGIDWAYEKCRTIFEANAAYGIHIFTLNRESGPIELCKRLGLWNQTPEKPLATKQEEKLNQIIEKIKFL